MFDEDRKGETNWKSKKGASALVLSQLSVTSLCIFPSRKELGWWGGSGVAAGELRPGEKWQLLLVVNFNLMGILKN